TESWWQQFLGEAIVGELTGKRLAMLPSRIESLANFRKRFPDGKLLVPTDPRMRRYGLNPYAGYDGSDWPMLFNGEGPKGIAPLARVVSVGNEAWRLELVRKQKKITKGDLLITWEPGQNSALDNALVSEGRDVGNVVVRRRTEDGLVDVVYGIDFAFAYNAFRPDGVIHTQ
ncbi:MAG: DUF3179 domain-containing (seleno)protein, partial [Alphaproteobacteria bacterium]